MKLILTEIPKNLDKAYLKQDLNREQIEVFKANLKILFSKSEIAEKKKEHEEHFKNIVSDFLKDTFYKNNFEININKRKDLVVHNGKSSSDSVGVIIEAKKPSNEAEMISQKTPNAKALHELLHYYLHERFINDNKELKHIIATNTYDWYIFDAADFERFFYDNKKIRKSYEDWNNGVLVGSNTDWFYNEVAKPYIDKELKELEVVHFNLLDYKKIIENDDIKDDDVLIELYKILSPEHLLKKSFANDSNTLNKEFYNELLHIIGLEERPDGGKKLISRKKPENRDDASLLENAINKLKIDNCLNNFENVEQYGISADEQLYSIGLELSITWLNRILFLKLLESQLITYHNGNKSYNFVNIDTIADFDILNELFFEVLAVEYKNRTKTVNEKFGNIPYLNSSLFEKSEIEKNTFQISNLKGRLELALYPHSILKKREANKHLEKKNTLHYLFEFLSAYKFSSDSSAKIQEDNKTIINASVLGLIFEKINGYKDGSFFTPGFITMYMCRETIRRAVAQKFKDLENKEIENFENVKTYCARYFKKEDIQRFNSHIDSLKVCDPAVGSGHFLVSALNEIIAIKSELNILIDSDGTPLEYEITVDNDELTILNKKTNKPFQYLLGEDNKPPKSLQQVQVTLFEEKQKIIENCLFGVDINPKSVLICRLRLWIELLKNAFYKPDNYTELETLPNIDINIKCGNSLISRYALDADIKTALKRSKWSIDSYRLAVMTYRNAKSKDEKREMERLIQTIKNDFESEIAINDKRLIKLNKTKGELFTLTTQTTLFERTKAEIALWNKQVKNLTDSIAQLEAEIEDIRSNKIYQNAFEWRFEFPEVLNEDGDFIGFDVIIGNPPYFSISTNSDLRVLADKYQTYVQTGDIYALFYELGLNILNNDGIQSLIVSNKWMRANYGIALRKCIIDNSNPLILLDFGQNLIFENATVYTNVIISQKSENKNQLLGVCFNNAFDFNSNIEEYISKTKINNIKVDEGIWNIINTNVSALKQKIESNNKRLGNWDILFSRGILTGLNEAFIIDGKKRAYIVEKEPESSKFIKPILRGRDTRSYYADFKDFWIINIPKGYTIKTNLGRTDIVCEPMPRYGNLVFDEAWQWFSENHPIVAEHLYPFKKKAEKRDDKGDYWWELRACSYIREFEKSKIIFSEIVTEPQFYYDEKGFYPEATVFFITGEKLKYLTALLNSKAVTFFFKSFFMGGDLGVAIRYKKIFLEQIPIPEPTQIQENNIIEIVDKIVKFKNEGKDTNALESEIDQLVYQLYGLSDEEIKIVEA